MKNVDYRRILLIKPSSLGDIVHALPMLAALRRRFPEAHIAWLVKRQWAGLVERAEGLDRVWPVGPGLGGWLSEVPRLRAEGFDLAVDLQGLLRSALMARLAGCPTRVGFANGREGSPLFYTQRVPVPTAEMHAVDRYLLVADAIGAGRREKPQFRFAIPSADREQVADALRRHGLRSGAAWIAMNVSARWPTKRWPLESFATVVDQLHDEGAGQVVLIGGPDDRADARTVQALTKTAPMDMTGATDVGLLPALLQSASLLL
ncbi:MAG: glycosyltransferase family 9 protein, partial [Nitrospiraceae bacterium]